jgi:dihydrofolate reductase
MKAIMAMAKNRAIGNKGQLPWEGKHKEDFVWFKDFTINKKIVIGKNTYETLPPLKNRTIWVLSKTIKESAGALIEPNSITMYHYTSNIDIIPKDAIVAGGKLIYELFMPHITEFYVTHIDTEYDGDVFMSPFEHLFSSQKVVKEFDFGKVICYNK